MLADWEKLRSVGPVEPIEKNQVMDTYSVRNLNALKIDVAAPSARAASVAPHRHTAVIRKVVIAAWVDPVVVALRPPPTHILHAKY